MVVFLVICLVLLLCYYWISEASKGYDVIALLPWIEHDPDVTPIARPEDNVLVVVQLRNKKILKGTAGDFCWKPIYRADKIDVKRFFIVQC